VVVRPALVESTTAFLIALPGTLAILVLNYIWVLRMDVPFEEASAELSEAIAKAREGRRGIGPRRPRAEAPTPFTLALDGPAETAILWKNLILISRFLSWKVLLRFAPILIFVIAVLAGGGFGGSKAQGLAVICALVGAVALLLGPQMMRSDLRHDLMSLAVLKTWPMRGATLVRGEILAPALVLSSIVAVALILATVLSTPTTQAAPIVGRWPALAAALLIAPGIILMQLLVQNAIAVSFPSWVAIGHQRSTGIDVMGQRLIMLAGSLVALLLAALPAALVAAVTGGIIYGLSGYVPVVLPGILAGLTLLAEAFIGSEIVGSILDHTDVSAIDAPQS
jgi:hypothetical protein